MKTDDGFPALIIYPHLNPLPEGEENRAVSLRNADLAGLNQSDFVPFSLVGDGPFLFPG